MNREQRRKFEHKVDKLMEKARNGNKQAQGQLMELNATIGASVVGVRIIRANGAVEEYVR
jgi:uncharacterized protein YigA (DUF484 family)